MYKVRSARHYALLQCNNHDDGGCGVKLVAKYESSVVCGRLQCMVLGTMKALCCK